MSSSRSLIKAKKLTAEVLARATESDDPKLEVAALRSSATIAYQQGSMAEAHNVAQQVLTPSREAGCREEEASALVMIGDAERGPRNFGAASAHYDAALALRRELGDRMAEAHSLHTLGALAEERDDPSEAERLLNEALALETEHGFRYLGGMTNNSLGILHDAKGDADRAQAHFERAVELCEEVGARQRSAHTLSNLSVALTRTEDWQQAFQVSARAMELSKETDSATTRGLLAYNHAYLGLLVDELEEAASSLIVAAEHYGANDPDVLIVSALLADKQGDPLLALELARRAKAGAGDAWDEEREGHLRRFELSTANPD